MSPPLGGGRGRGGKRSRSQSGEPPALTATDAAAWFAGRLPDDWFVEPPTVEIDREEILVIGELPAPKRPKAKSGSKKSESKKSESKKSESKAAAADDADPAVAEHARISGFREDTREQRMAVAEEAQRRFGRTVSWGASCGDSEHVFTVANVPVMTRLRLEERQVLDTLIEAGVARSRSEAMAWCVRLVGENEASWIASLREAMSGVAEARDRGPDSNRST